MHTYRVLGGVLHSELDFPELVAAPSGGAVRWSLSTGTAAPPALTLPPPLGSDDVRGAGDVQLFQHADGFRLTYPDTGTYDVVDRGSRIIWFPPAQRPYPDDRFLEAVRIDVLGRVLAVALHAAGTESLHGSAVVFGNGGAVAFVAPKFHGKSTLASALVAQGARLITDDTLPVEPGDPPRAAPGVHSVRMWEDSAGRLGGQLGLEPGPWGKLRSSRMPEDWIADGPIPFAAIYVLSPRQAGAEIARQRLAPMEAAVSLIAHAKLGPLLGKDAAAGLLAWAARLAQAVPVYRLAIPRDFARLDDVVERLRAWHAPS